MAYTPSFTGGKTQVSHSYLPTTLLWLKVGWTRGKRKLAGSLVYNSRLLSSQLWLHEIGNEVDNTASHLASQLASQPVSRLGSETILYSLTWHGHVAVSSNYFLIYLLRWYVEGLFWHWWLLNMISKSLSLCSLAAVFLSWERLSSYLCCCSL